MANIFRVERTANKITLGTAGTTINVASHTASLLLGLDASKNLESVDLSSVYQPLDAGLTSLSGLTYASDSFIKVTAEDTYTIRTLAEVRTDLGLVIGTNVLAQQTIGIANDNLLEVDDADAVATDYARFTANGLQGRDITEVKTDLGLVIGTNVQAWDAGLDSLAALGYVSDSMIKITAEDTYAIRTLAEVKTDLSLNLVENTAHSTDAHTMTIDGRDVSVDGTKLDGIEALADVTATNETSHADVVVDGDFASNGILNRTGAGAYSILALGTDVQAYHANLGAIAAGNWTGANSITTLGTIGTGTWGATDVAILHGGTGQSTAQAAIDALTAVLGATNEHVLTKDTATGNAIWKATAGGTDEKVKIDVGAAAGYIGAASNDGVLRTTTGLSYADGGNFVTLGLSHLGIESLADPDTDRCLFWDDSESAIKWLTVMQGVQINGTKLQFDVNSLTEDTTPATNDYLVTFDVSHATPGYEHKKVLISNFPHGYLGYIKLSDVKAQNTAGGTFTNGAWRTRTLNTEDSDTNNDCSLAANQITLTAGTYECHIICPANKVDYHQARLYNTTGASVVLLGSSSYSSAAHGHANQSIIIGRFTIASSQALEVQHQCQITDADDGFGLACNFASEVYAMAEFWRVS